MDSGAPKDTAGATIRILFLEDRDEDAALVERALAAAGMSYSLRRVNSEAGYRTELVTEPDVILSDHDLPGYDGMRALELARGSYPDLPFILVSGRISGELRREALRRGANEVLSKERLDRLVPAVRAALQMAELRSRAHRARQQLARNEHELHNAFDHTAVGMALTTLDGHWLKVNGAFCDITGYTAADLLQRDCHSITHPDDVPEDVELLKRLLGGELSSTQREKRYLHRNGHVIWVQVTASLVRGNDGEPLYRVLQVLDITHQREAEERFRATFEQAAVGFAHIDLHHRIIRVNRRYCEIVGYSPEELIGRTPGMFNHRDDLSRGSGQRKRLLAGDIDQYSHEKRYIRKDGALIWVKRTESLARDDAGKPMYYVRVVEDITDRKRTETRLEQSNRARRVLAECSHALVHARGERELLQEMCRIIVESGGYRQGWIGLATGDADRPLHTAAHAGYGDDLPLTPPPGAGPEVLRRGVAFQAFASGRTTIVRDLLKQEGPENEWRRARAERHHFQSSIGLPLMAEALKLGVLVMHAAEPDAFDEEEIALLTTLANDVAHGITSVRADAARRQAEARLARLARAHRVMAECNHALVHAMNEAELLEQMCRIAVESGGFKQAWVGLGTGDAARPIYPAAYAGYPAGDGPMRSAVTWSPDGRYQGAMGQVLASGEIRIARDILNNPQQAHRRERALARGFQSSIMLPLVNDGSVLGAVALYAAEPDAFDEEELGLLKDMADDMAFGIATLRTRIARRNAEEALRASEERFRILTELSSDWSWEQDAELRFTSVSRTVNSHAGISADAHMGRTRWELPNTYPVNTTWDEHKAVLAARQPFRDLLLKRIGQDGSVNYVSVSGDPVFDAHGEFSGYRGVAKNITDRIKAEHGLRESERRFRDIFSQAAVGITRIDLDGTLIEVNQKFCDMLGYSGDELVGRSVRDITHPDDYEPGSQYRVRLARGDAKSVAGEKRFLRRDGTIMWARRTMSVAQDHAGNPQYVISVVEDITERKRAEEELRRTTEITRLLESLARAANEAASPEAAMRTCLERICQHGGWALGRLGIYGPGEGERFPENSLWHASDPERYAALMRASLDPKYFVAGGRFISVVLHEKRPVWLGDISTATGFGRMTVARECGLHSAFAFPVLVGGEVAAFLEFFATETREPDALLLEAVASVGAQLARLIERSRSMASAAQLAAIVESSQDGMISTTPNGTILTWNAGAERLFGYSAAEAVGCNVSMLFPEQRRHEIGQSRAAAIAGEQYGPHDTERRAKDGRSVQVSVSASPLKNGAGEVTGVALIYRDIADRKRAEAEIARERALLRTIIDTLPDYIYVKDRDGRFQLGNRAWLWARGIAEEGIAGKTVFDIFPREIAERMAAQDARIVEGGPPLLDEEQMVVVKMPDGRHSETRWSSTSKVPMRDAAGGIIGTIGISRDITEQTLSARRRAMEHAVTRVLAESATMDEAMPQLLRTIGEAMGWAYGARWSWSQEENTLVRREHWSDSPVDFSGPDEEAWVRMRFLSPGGLLRRAWVQKAATWIADIEQDGTLSRRHRALELGFRSAYSFPILDGRDVIGVMEFFGREVREPDDMLLQITGAVGHQIGQFIRHRQAEEALRTSEATLRATFDQANVGIAITSPDLRFVQINDRYAELLGYTGAELLGKSIALVQTPEGMVDSAEIRRRLSADDKAGTFREKQLVRKDGARVWVAVSTSLVRDDRGAAKHCITVIQDMSERKRAEAERAQLAAIVEGSDDAIVSRALDGTVLSWNSGAERMFGYTAEEMIGRHVGTLAPPENAHESRHNTEALLRGESVPPFASVRLTKGGQPIHVLISVSPVRDGAGSLVAVSAIFRDISERRRAEAALQESEEQFRQLANNIPQVFWITDVSQKRTIYMSPAVERLIGHPVPDIQSNSRLLIRAMHEEDRPRVHRARQAAVKGGYDETYRIVRPDGTVRWVHDRAFPVRDAAGNVYRIAGIAEDITERKLAEERLMHLAHYDVLTSLPNRVLFYDRLKQALAQAKRNQWITGVMFIDIDRFKNVNDTLGHAVGDKLLQEVSGRLVGSVRSGDTVGRLGGDEFAIVLSNLSSAQDANMVAQKVMASFDVPFRLEGAEVFVTASIGITLYPDDSTDQDTLIKNADAAMYRAKEIGRNCYQFYTPEMNARALEILSMESSLRRGLERKEFLLYFQPKASVASGAIVGVEALIRWRHPERGLVSPAQFMPVLEETGLIVPVGEWVLHAVCDQIKAWEAAGIRSRPVAVNLSARQFAARDFGRTIKRILEEHRIDPALIELEITESSLMTNTEEAVRTLEYLENLGVGLSIDDFGTGYSSLGYLKRFPLDSLKIDRSFVRDVTSDGDDATITRAVISMAHSLGLKVIAEGVETEEQLSFLAEYGCDEIQGYYFSRPLAAEECGTWLLEDRLMRRPFQPAESGAPVVLLVDDDEDALMLLKRGLSRDGYQILLARNAAEALNLLGIHRVDVIITDQNMPGMAGTEFLQRVKSLYPGTIRMITSGFTDFNMMADAVNKGEVSRFLPKNMTDEELRSDVREALQSRSRLVPPIAA